MADVFEQIDKVDSRALLSSLRENVVRLDRMTAEVERAFVQRELSFYKEMVIAAIEYTGEPLSTVEQKIIDGLAAVWMFNNRPNRSIPKLKSRKHTLLSFADSIVQSAHESSGYKELKAAGFEHLLFERTVLDHPEFFSQKAQDASRARLGEMNRQALGTLDHVGEDLRHTATQLERLGFKRFSRDGYAYREREIVHISRVEEADFDNGVARIWPGESKKGALYASDTSISTWRQRIEEIDAGQYLTAYVVFGYRAEAAENRKSGDTVALYKMTALHRIGEEIFAGISPAANTGKSAQDSPTNHEIDTGKRFTRAPIRPEQFAFRRALFERFNDRCALTGCTVGQLLDAAHLPGRNWSVGKNSADDGILLRADLHRALDNDLIRLDEHLRLVWVDESVFDLYGHLLSGTLPNRSRISPPTY